jgi:copper chaperone
MAEISMKVPDLSCMHCVAAVRRALGEVDGVGAVEVSLEGKVVKVTAGDEVDAGALLKVVRDAGYTPELAG